MSCNKYLIPYETLRGLLYATEALSKVLFCPLRGDIYWLKSIEQPLFELHSLNFTVRKMQAYKMPFTSSQKNVNMVM